ncbi:MAG: hypothetical protein JSV86_21585 [Gemmatimonadota bacterium]|nr:MAG: hypothetical protein JSV86_21585 [Gemmatimonadota bacterium]
MGYVWHPWIKMIPYDGATETVDLTSMLSDLSAPQATDLRYDPEVDSVTDVNLDLRPLMFGYRPVVTFRMLIFTIADHEQYAEILGWLMDYRLQMQNDYGAGVFLSLDNEQTYRRVVLDNHTGPNAIRGKTTVGASFDLTLRCVDLIDEIPYLDPDGSTSVARW